VSYLLHFSGPSSFEQTIALKPGGESVVVGRDPEAAVYLPDTERLVSRRHLSIEWCEGGARVRVLSANGINTDQGDWFSGDEVVLADGESARVGSFFMFVTAVPADDQLDSTSFSGMGSRPVPVGPDTRAAPPAPGGAEKDPWAELAAQWSPGRANAASSDPTIPEPPAAAPVSFDLDDPFTASASWRLNSAAFSAVDATAPLVEPDPLAALAREYSAQPAPAPTPTGTPTPEKLALQSFCRGLGVEPPQVLVDFDWERMGESVREVVRCLAEQLASRNESRHDMRAADRTLLGSSATNPLREGMPLKELLQYLLFMPEGGGGFVPAARALQEAAQEARWHEAAGRAAARGLADGALREFEPAKLRAELLRGKLSFALVDNARLWDLYTADYARKGERPGEWAEQLFNRYYMAAYLRESEKLRRVSAPLPPRRDA
jgi:type VI secretion system FHA domain protein